MTPQALRDRRRALELSGHQMAEQLGIAPSTWFKWEYGWHKPPVFLDLALKWLEHQGHLNAVADAEVNPEINAEVNPEPAIQK